MRLSGDRSVEGTLAVFRLMRHNQERQRAKTEADAKSTPIVAPPRPERVAAAVEPLTPPPTSPKESQAPALLPVATVLARKHAAMIASRPRGWRPWDQRESAQGGA
jgi:hypothetical protein